MLPLTLHHNFLLLDIFLLCLEDFIFIFTSFTSAKK